MPDPRHQFRQQPAQLHRVDMSKTGTLMAAAAFPRRSESEKKKETRAATKEIIAALDALLPPTSTSSQSQRVSDRVKSRSCGSRSLGRTGRSLIAILQDAAALVRHKKARIESQTQKHLEMRQARAKALESARVPGILKGGMLSSLSMLTIEVSFPTCQITSVGSGFVSLIQQRVSNESQTFPPDTVEDIITKMTLYHFIHPEDVELLRMFVKGNYWTYGKVLEDANTISVRVAPCETPPPQTDYTQPDHSTMLHAEPSLSDLPHTPQTLTHTPEIHLKLIGLDPMTRSGVFVSV